MNIKRGCDTTCLVRRRYYHWKCARIDINICQTLYPVDILMFISASITSSVKAFDLINHGIIVREVADSNPGRGTKEGGVFHPTSQLARFSSKNKSSNDNYISLRVSLHGEVINYRPYASPSFGVVMPHKIAAISTIRPLFGL